MEVGTASRPKPGEEVCGDQWLVRSRPEGTLIAVADGLGHGPDAHEASTAACRFLDKQPGKAVARMIEDCSRAISHTRGAALSILHIDEQGYTAFAGVGNVEIIARTHEKMRAVNSPGIVGRRIRRVIECEHQLVEGDTLILYSDGISSRMHVEDFLMLPAQAMADAILARHNKEHDDATVVAVRY